MLGPCCSLSKQALRCLHLYQTNSEKEKKKKPTALKTATMQRSPVDNVVVARIYEVAAVAVWYTPGAKLASDVLEKDNTSSVFAVAPVLLAGALFWSTALLR